MRAGIRVLLIVSVAVGLSLCGCASAPPGEVFPTDPAAAVSGPAWWGFGRDAQHTAVGAGAAPDLARIVWHKRVDLSTTAIGADGAVYAMSDAIVYVVGQ
jgi:hypothetical protein